MSDSSPIATVASAFDRQAVSVHPATRSRSGYAVFAVEPRASKPFELSTRKAHLAAPQRQPARQWQASSLLGVTRLVQVIAAAAIALRPCAMTRRGRD
ncbi:hypothetical protein [Dokdonella sp.]|uniref:hypothetical protein n=1 Tax=Dokdonella sp. TaxID=2291710 RepID=UPI0025C2882D|nr:hypothetical protein [Dokdonella sp.]